MASALARKFFSRRGTITGGAAISYAALMRSFPAVTGTTAWGLSSDGNISADSFVGDGVSLIPVTAVVYVGYDAQVADADAAATYVGVPVVAGEPFSFTDYCRGVVDTNAVFIYSATTQLIDLIFIGV